MKTSIRFFLSILIISVSAYASEKSSKQRLADPPRKDLHSRKDPGLDTRQKDSASPVPSKTRAAQYAEVEIRMDNNRTLESLKQIPQAPGSQMQIDKDGRRVRMQVSKAELARLQNSGSKVKVLRKLLLLEGKKEKPKLLPKANPNDDSVEGENDTDWAIPEGDWTWSEIIISTAPSGAVVTTIDVHYEIIHPWVGDLQVDLADVNLLREYNLHEADGFDGVNLNEDVYDITIFAGLPVNQEWRLWVADYYTGDTGYIDYWWIKVYYNFPPANDECINAVAITLDTPYYGSTSGSMGADISICGINDMADVWHSFTPSATRDYVISLCGSSFDTTLAVYDACGGIELDCSDDACGLQSELILSAAAYQPYLIRISGYDGATGDYILTVSEAAPPPSPEPNVPGPADREYDITRDTWLTWNQGAQILQNIMPSSLFRTQSIITPKGIYGTDDRLDEYQVTDSDWLDVGDSVAVMVSLYEVVDNGDGTYTLPSDTMDDIYFSLYDTHLCTDEPFRTQPSAGYCTGVLVAPDIIATAGHCIVNTNECSEFAFVFGYKMLDASTPALTVDESDLYFCNGIIDRIETVNDDWGLIRLDRPVLTHAPLQVRRNGQVANGQELLVIGYPFGIPVKYADNAWVQDNTASEYFLANLDTYFGNSGSPVFNINTFEVEGLLVGGLADFETVGSCDKSIVYPDIPGSEQCTRTTQFSTQIPVFDVYFGTEPNQLSRICAEVPYPWCPVGPLDCGRNYYWQVIHKENSVQTPGPVWVFSTEYVGDLDHSCTVNTGDFQALAAAWLMEACNQDNNYCAEADMDKLGSVNIEDLALLLTHWTESLTP